jgi:hypothetical protein
MHSSLIFAAAASLIITSGCASTRSESTPAPSPAPSSSEPTTPPIAARWPVKSLPHVDLWIHSFALISDDTATVPLYRRGYRDSVIVVKNRLNLLTTLDANRLVLTRGLQSNPGYIQSQFLAFEFADWEQMRTSIERFVQLQGDVQRAPNEAVAQHVAAWGRIFRTAADREWLRLFLSSVTDEAARFYNAQRAQAWRERSTVVAAIDSMWHRTYMPQFERFLSNSQQRNGDLILSMPLGGEGRATSGRDGRALIAVTFPSTIATARESMIVLAHEAVGGIVGSVVDDNTSPADKREGAAEKLVAIGQVRAGAMLLERVAPDLLPEYVRYYLWQGGKGSGTTAAALAQAFPLPQTVVDGLKRQIDVVLGGI